MTTLRRLSVGLLVVAGMMGAVMVQVRETHAAERPSLASLQAQIDALNQKISALLEVMEVRNEDETINGLSGPHVIFKGVNVHIRNSDDSGYTYNHNGKGNLIIGYNAGNNKNRGGSHNIIVGDDHTYTEESNGGVVFGNNNTIDAQGATITGGWQNTVTDYLTYSSISGGYDVLLRQFPSGGDYLWAARGTVLPW